MDRYIKLPRALYESSAWKSATGEQVKAFLDLCFRASFAEHNANSKFGNVQLKVGQIAVSLRQLAEDWNCDICKVRRILKFLENNELITKSIASSNEATQETTHKTTHGSTRYTLLTINHIYESATSTMTQEATQETTHIHNKGLNNLSKDKSRGRERAREGKPSQPFPPSVQEIQSYLDEKLITGFTAQEFYDYYDTVGWVVGKNKPMKSWQGAVRTWVTKRKKESNQYGNSNSQPNTDRQADATIRQQQFEQHIISRLTGATTVPKPKLPF